MEYVQDRISTLHDFTDPSPSVDRDALTVIIPFAAKGGVSRTTRRTFRLLERDPPGRVILPVRGTSDEVRSFRSVIDEGELDLEVLWCNRPSMNHLLEDSGLLGVTGKGLDLWLGLAVATQTDGPIVVHDADNRSYERSDVARLAWPLEQGFDFAKGYYARIEDRRLYGRLTRLLVHPILEAARRQTGADLFEYLTAFRYPLAGECSMTASFAKTLRPSPDWGFELSTLVDAYREVGFDGSAQVDLGTHAHDHRPIDGEQGLTALAEDVIRTVLNAAEQTDTGLSIEHLRRAYPPIAERYRHQFELDATFNGLEYDRRSERQQIDLYSDLISLPSEDPRLPSIDDRPFTPETVRQASRPPA